MKVTISKEIRESFESKYRNKKDRSPLSQEEEDNIAKWVQQAIEQGLNPHTVVSDSVEAFIIMIPDKPKVKIFDNKNGKVFQMLTLCADEVEKFIYLNTIEPSFADYYEKAAGTMIVVAGGVERKEKPKIDESKVQQAQPKAREDDQPYFVTVYVRFWDVLEFEETNKPSQPSGVKKFK